MSENNIDPLKIFTAYMAYQGRNYRPNSVWEYFWPVVLGLGVPLGLVWFFVFLMGLGDTP